MVDSAHGKRPVICCLSDFSAEYPGSFIDALLALAQYCRRHMRIDLLCVFPEAAKQSGWLDRFDAEGIGYGFIPRKGKIIPAIRSLLHGCEPLIFHTHFSLYDRYSLLLKMLSYKKSKIVWHYHSHPSASTFLQRVKQATKLRLVGPCLSDRCVAVGDGVYRALLAAGYPARKLLLVRNGVNTQRYCSNPAERRRARAFLGVDDGQTVFLLLGWDPLRKGCDTFIQSAGEVVRSKPTGHYFLIIARRRTREFIAPQTEAAQVGRSLRVLDPSPDFASILSGIDVFVSCSRNEAFSYAVAEAMAAEKPVICSDAVGMREIYGAASGVWFFPCEDAKALAELMQRAAELREIDRKELGRANRAYIVARYSLDGWVEKMGRVYSSLLEDATPERM